MASDTVAAAACDLASGQTTSTELTDRCFARIHEPDGEGGRTYIRLFEREARGAASGVDRMRQAGVPLPPLAGVPVSIKDLCDVAGSITTAGSISLKDAPAATDDAPIVARLRAAGTIILGTTNMTEFAFGGLGLNPHYGTPRNPFEREIGRIPGGSSSGAAVSVTDGMAIAAVGSDTAGSVRMPAALCGLAGFKPTARRIPIDGTVPLAVSLDSIGVLARTVQCCALLDAILAAERRPHSESPVPLDGLRFAVPTTLVMDDLEPPVSAAFSQALSRLSEAGARIIDIPFKELGELPGLNARGGFPVAEGFAWHRKLFERKRDMYDPVIAARIATGASVNVADYLDLCVARKRLIEQSEKVTRNYDAILLPTVPIIAPPISDFDNNEERWLATNRRLIRNPGVANFLDRCALTIPCHAPGSAPVGLTLMGEAQADHRILSIGRSAETVLAQSGAARGGVSA
jgi:aspartyl-tRNA(Asn)/glutamyl-tRNA(Gln) amidotransferase subunit A